MVKIEIAAHGFIHIPVAIRPKGNLTMTKLLYKVDTGADATTISKKKLNDLGYDDSWIKSGRRLAGVERPTVASGKSLDDCYQVVLPEIHIGDWVGYNWSFLTSLSVPFRLLLGTDSLQYFNWALDYGHGVCKFELIPGKRRLLFDQKEQSIHAIDELQDTFETEHELAEFSEVERQVMLYIKMLYKMELKEDGKYGYVGRIVTVDVMKALQSLIERKYIIKQDNVYSLTPLGMQVKIT